MPNISKINKKMNDLPKFVLAKEINVIPKQNLQKYISFGLFFSQLNYEAKVLFQYMAKVIEFDGGITELCRAVNYKNTYIDKKSGKTRYSATQFKRLGIEKLKDNGVISVTKQGHGYILKLNPLYFGE